MKLRARFSRGADKIVPTDKLSPLLAALECADFKIKPRCTEALRSLIRRKLRELGWTDRIKIAPQSNITITAVNGDVGLCIQLGNMARFYADLLKLQVLYLDHRIKSAVYVMPTRTAAKAIGQNIANSERMMNELELYEKIVTIPLVIVELQGE